MIRSAMIAVAALAMSSTPVFAKAPCKDPKTGKFIKCPDAAKPAVAGVTQGKDGKCRTAKGRFAKCP